MRRFKLYLDEHLTTGVVELYNSLARLYSRIENAIVPDLTSGVCLLHKSSAGEAGVVPRPLDTEAALAVLSGAYAGCIPNSELAKGAHLALSTAVSACVVLDASGDGQLNCAVQGGSAVEVSVQPANTDIFHMLGDVHSMVEVWLSCAEVGLRKWPNIQFAVMPHCNMCAAQEKSGGGESSIVVLAEAAAFTGCLRRLYEADQMTLAEMDGMTLDDLDYTILDS